MLAFHTPTRPKASILDTALSVDNNVAKTREFIGEIRQLLCKLYDVFDGLHDQTTQMASSVGPIGTNSEIAGLRQRLSDMKYEDVITKIHGNVDELELPQSQIVAKIREAEARELQRLKEKERALRFAKEEAEAERRAKFEEAAREKERLLREEEERLRRQDEARERQRLREEEERAVRLAKTEVEHRAKLEEAARKRERLLEEEEDRTRRAAEARDRQRLKEEEERALRLAKEKAGVERRAKFEEAARKRERLLEEEEERSRRAAEARERQRLKEEEERVLQLAKEKAEAERRAQLEEATREKERLRKEEEERLRREAEARERQRLKEEEERVLQLAKEKAEAERRAQLEEAKELERLRKQYVSRAENIQKLQNRWKCEKRLGQPSCLGAYCYKSDKPGSVHLPLNRERLECWASAMLKNDDSATVEMPPNHHLFQVDTDAAESAPLPPTILQRRRLELQNPKSTPASASSAPVFNISAGEAVLDLIRPRPAIEHPEPAALTVPSNQGKMLLGPARILGPDMSIDQFCESFGLQPSIRARLEVNGYYYARNLRFVTLDDLMEMGFKLGEKASLQDAVERWSVPQVA